jgi:hypothetical protein
LRFGEQGIFDTWAAHSQAACKHFPKTAQPEVRIPRLRAQHKTLPLSGEERIPGLRAQ